VINLEFLVWGHNKLGEINDSIVSEVVEQFN